jgi:hypothetical protein
MSITAECNVCGKKYEAPDNLAGKRVRCKQCGNIFDIPGGSSDGPDLDALAEMERSHHSLDATNAGEHTAAEDSDEDGGESPRALRSGRTNVRFAFPLAKEIDTWAPLVLTLGGLGWLASFIFHVDPSAPPVPRWLQAIWFAVALLAYWMVISPISLSLLRSAGRSLGYQMPINDRRRAFAAFLPPFVLAYVMWATGGTLVALILGCLAGIAVASATVWLLFRLRPHEIAPTALYCGIGFVIGMAIASGVFFGLNTLAVNALVAAKQPDLLPASPFGPAPAMAWISDDDKSKIHAELAAAAHPPPAPGSVKPEPTAPPPPIASPIVKNSDVSPISGDFEEVINPLVDSKSLAVVRHGDDNNNIDIEVFNIDSWKSQGSIKFDTRAEAGRRRVLSPDGKLLARIVSFPSLSVQTSSFADSRVNNVYFNDIPGTPELVGFLSNSALLIQWQKELNRTALEIVDVSTHARIARTGDLPAFTLGESTLAVSHDGTMAAIAVKLNNVPTILIYNLQNGAQQAVVRILSLDAKWPVTPTGLAFSPDNRQLAVLFEQSGAALLQCYQFAADQTSMKQQLEQVYPAGPIRGGSPRQYSGSALAWLPNSDGWLIYGQAAFSASTGQSFAELGISDVWSCRVIAPDLAELVTDPNGASGSKQLTMLHLDNAKIAAMAK